MRHLGQTFPQALARAGAAQLTQLALHVAKGGLGWAKILHLYKKDKRIHVIFITRRCL